MKRLLFGLIASTASLSAQVEDAAARAKLPEFQVIPAAKPGELTPSDGLPQAVGMRTWTVSHGDAGARRYSALSGRALRRTFVGQVSY